MSVLPVPATRLVGRDREAAEVRRLLATSRLVTLAGVGGSGKTRLALHVAGAWPEEVRWVDLAALEDPDLVPQRVAAAVDAPDAPGRPILPALVAHLAGCRGLLVLDNCEHLIGACADLVDRLLRAAPDLHVLATSREPLAVGGEACWPVPPLALPDPAPRSAAELLRSPAVQLLVDRARAVTPGYAPADADAAAVAQLCHRLDGLPLALELAAARLRVLSVPQLLDRLDTDPRLLADRSRTAVPRQRTLLATMDWSHDLLRADEQRLFRRLAAFPGSFDLEAVEAVASATGTAREQVLDLLSGLVDRSLVAVAGGPGARRYRLLETVRRYAADKLAAAGETAQVRDAHAAHVLAMAAAAEPGLLGPGQRDWVARLAAEHDGIAAALAWLLERGDALGGLRLAGRLGRYWWFAGRFTEGAAWLHAFLALPAAQAPTPERAAALHALGLATFWHETEAAGVAASRARFEEAVAILREHGDMPALVAALRDLGSYWKGQGDQPAARAVLAESSALAERLGDPVAVAAADAYLGILAVYDGDVDGARFLLERALAVLADRGGADEALRCAFFLACLECDAGNAAAARARFVGIMALDPLGALPYVAGFALDGLARLAVAEGQPRRALRLLGAAGATHERLGTSAGPAYDAYVRRGLAPARALLGEAAAERAEAGGRLLTVRDAIAEGLRPRPATAAGPLSAREAEVLRLAAEGLSDAQIAAALHLSRRTVGNHLSSAYRKLGVGSRTAAIHRATTLDAW